MMKNTKSQRVFTSPNIELRIISTVHDEQSAIEEITVEVYSSFSGELLFEESFGSDPDSSISAEYFIESNFKAKEQK